MTVRAYEIAADQKLIPLASESLAEKCRDAASVLWIDLQASSELELALYLDMAAVRGLSRRIVLEASVRRGLYPLKNELVLILSIPPSGADHAGGNFVTCVCRDNLLLTIHATPLFQDGSSLDDSDSWLPAGRAAGLLASAVFHLSQLMLKRTAEFRRTILAIEDRMERDAESVSANELVALRPDLAELSSVVTDQVPAVQALSAIDKPYFKLAEAQDLVHCALASMAACERTAAGLEQRLVGLRAAFQMHAQDRTNARLNTLTVLSSIFMPITLLAGIWGMNFKAMPELEVSFGYPLALACMALVAGGMYAIFRRTGWFD